MSEFVAGFVARHAAPAERLRAVLEPESGFAARSPRGPVSFTPRGADMGPRHFSPADPDRDPTAGWDPFDADAPQTVTIVDPVEAARARGYAEGLEAAAAELRGAERRDAAMLESLVEALGAAGRIDREAMAGRLRATVMLLVGRLVGEVGVSAELLTRRVAAAAELLADASESALLRVHPDDVALLEGRLPDRLFAAGDASLERGSFVLESASTVVEDGPEHWLEQLAQAIDRVPLPTGPSPC